MSKKHIKHDVFEKGLDPTVPHTNIGLDGRLVSPIGVEEKTQEIVEPFLQEVLAVNVIENNQEELQPVVEELESKKEDEEAVSLSSTNNKKTTKKKK